MAQGLARYHGRSPRYILNTQDDSLIRVAGPRQMPWEEGTEIKNISLTGLGFTAPSDLCPLLGEVIKIQFEVPGSQPMACYAVVTRIDPLKQQKMLVGVHFYKLEMAQRIALAQGLSRKLKDQVDQQLITENSKITLSASDFFKVLVMSSLLSAWAFFTWALATGLYINWSIFF
jgi:PilZ domain